MRIYLEDYFEFLSPEDIRIKVTRIGIEHILYEYIHRAQPPEAIKKQFPPVTLEQVYATILYYFQQKDAVTKYVGDWLDYCLKAEAEFDKNPPDFVEKIQQFKLQQKSAKLLSIK